MDANAPYLPGSNAPQPGNTHATLEFARKTGRFTVVRVSSYT